MGLRDIQLEDMDLQLQTLNQGINRALDVAPCGYGKTVFMSHLPEALDMQKGEQMLVLTHLDKLAKQTEQKLLKYNPSLKIDVEQAKRRCDPDADVIIGSVQSIGHAKYDKESDTWTYSDRLTKFDPTRVTKIVTDEAHHAAFGTTYHNIYRYLGVLPSYEPTFDPSKIHIGFTATPHPAGLDHIYEAIAFQRELRQMVELGYAAEIRAYRLYTQVSLDKVGVTAGDFIKSQLEKTVNTPERNQIVVDGYKKHGEGFPFVAFTVDVQHSMDLAAKFQENGISAIGIHGKTQDRDTLFDLYEAGGFKGICTCQVVTEGVDLPIATVGLMCRPTKSIVFYTQTVGRLLRPYPSPEDLEAMIKIGKRPLWIKPYAVIIDFCDLYAKHKLGGIASLFGLRDDFDFKGGKVVDTIEKIEKVVKEKNGALAVSEFTDLSSLTTFSESIDLLAVPAPPKEMTGLSKFSWMGGLTGGYSLCLPDYKTLTVRQDALGIWKVSQSVNGIASFLGEHSTLKGAISLADNRIPNEARNLMRADASWRREPISVPQLETIWKLSHSHRKQFSNNKDAFLTHLSNTMTMGDANNVIQSLFRR